MGVYATELATLTTKLDDATYLYKIAEGSESMTIKTRSMADNSVVLNDWTGTGGLVQMATDWRAANGSVSSGEMYDLWSEINSASTSDKNTEIAALLKNVTYLTKKKAHYQAIVDNGEDPTGLTLEDMADIEAVAP